MTVEITEHKGIIIAVLSGDFDLYSAPSARDVILKHAATEGHRLLVDLSDVKYMDSSGIGTLIRLLQHTREKKGRLVFAGLQPSPHKVLDMANILPLLNTVATSEEGIEKLA